MTGASFFDFGLPRLPVLVMRCRYVVGVTVSEWFNREMAWPLMHGVDIVKYLPREWERFKAGEDLIARSVTGMGLSRSVR
jgi:hypothetical protein